MKVNKKQLSFLMIAFLTVCVVVVLSFNAVNNTLTHEDIEYIPMYLGGIIPLSEKPEFKDEVNFIVSVQRSVLNIASGNDGLPFSHKREPKELYEAATGLCYDRSRVIEKILQYSGFETRHISIFSKEETNSTIISLITPNISSHAVTEVLTKNGWLVVDSNASWLSVDKNNHPLSIRNIQYSIDNSIDIDWMKQPPSGIYEHSFVFVFGLYSRHGKFYPPYNFIPDIHYGELIQNIF